MFLGLEAMNTKSIPVYVLPKMKSYLSKNGPWSQLVKLNNITLNEMKEDIHIVLDNILVTAIRVPHRDEYSETAGFKIHTSNAKYLFIPDCDTWDKWNRNIIKEVADVDIALLDGTFFSGDELPGRNIK
jgi:pyrroloquinoline quinone biosynthesis protein B